MDAKGGRIEHSYASVNQSTYIPDPEIQKVIYDTNYLSYLERKSQGEESGLPGLQHSRTGEKRHIFAQYEMMKSGLKEDFERKMFTMRHRLTQRGQKDPSFWLFN